MIVDAFYEGYSSYDDENIIENIDDIQILYFRDVSFENVLSVEWSNFIKGIGQIAFKKGFKDFFIKIEDSEFKNDTIRVSVHNCSK